jgi:hypothetical protein
LTITPLPALRRLGRYHRHIPPRRVAERLGDDGTGLLDLVTLAGSTAGHRALPVDLEVAFTDLTHHPFVRLLLAPLVLALDFIDEYLHAPERVGLHTAQS